MSDEKVMFTKEELQQAVMATYLEDKDNPDPLLGFAGASLAALKAASADLTDVYINTIINHRNVSRVIN